MEVQIYKEFEFSTPKTSRFNDTAEYMCGNIISKKTSSLQTTNPF
jgi:hypothetical protein